jgi:dephospho-CoA kinase
VVRSEHEEAQVLAVGITGGIGAGKSALAELLVARGAELIDGDQIAREVVEPHSAILDALIEHFGRTILQVDGRLDRRRLADIAFSDPDELAALNGIMHPVIRAEMVARRGAAEGSEGIVLYAVPLLTAGLRESMGLDCVVVVDCPVELAVQRLVAQRGFSEHEAQARIDAQMTREERNKLGDYVVLNDGNRDELVRHADLLWHDLKERARHDG